MWLGPAGRPAPPSSRAPSASVTPIRHSVTSDPAGPEIPRHGPAADPRCPSGRGRPRARALRARRRPLLPPARPLVAVARAQAADPLGPGAGDQHQLHVTCRAAVRLPQRDARLRGVLDQPQARLRPRARPGGADPARRAARPVRGLPLGRSSVRRLRALLRRRAAGPNALVARRARAAEARGQADRRLSLRGGWAARQRDPQGRAVERLQRDPARRGGPGRGRRARTPRRVRPPRGRDPRLRRPGRGPAAPRRRLPLPAPDGGMATRRSAGGRGADGRALAQPSALQGHALPRRGGRGAEGRRAADRARARPGHADRRGTEDVRARGRDRRPIPDRRLRAVRDRGDVARQAGALLPERALRAAPPRVGRMPDREHEPGQLPRQPAAAGRRPGAAGRARSPRSSLRREAPLPAGRRVAAGRDLPRALGSMRILHVGNVANNGCLNAKFQRREEIEADAICDETHILSLPEWEDADLHGPFEPYPNPDELARAGNWRRPPWILGPADPAARRRFPGQFFLDGLARSYVEPLVRPSIAARVRKDYAPLEPVLGPLRPFDVNRGLLALQRFALLWPEPQRLFGGYDVVEAYATHPILAYLAGGAPFVAFEHGTMRELPFEDSWRGRLLSVAYRMAAKVVITNPDVIGSARRLGLENTIFIPHPVDETKYTPGASPLRAELGVADDERLLVSPSSQTWHLKGNDALLRGFAEYLRGGGRAVLVLTDWGPDVERSRALACELGLEERLRWLAPLPKLRLIEAYRAADLVLDQFVLGTFGAIAPEAMACGTAVVMAFDPGVHEWCFPEPPPVIPAREPGEIAAALTRLLGDDKEREHLGTASRRWVEEQHGWQLVTDRHRAVYEGALGARQ